MMKNKIILFILFILSDFLSCTKQKYTEVTQYVNRNSFGHGNVKVESILSNQRFLQNG